MKTATQFKASAATPRAGERIEVKGTDWRGKVSGDWTRYVVVKSGKDRFKARPVGTDHEGFWFGDSTEGVRWRRVKQ